MALQRCDWEGERSDEVGEFLFSNSELQSWLNAELGTLHGRMVKLNEGWFRTETTLNLTGSLYQVPEDTYNVKGFDKLVAGEPQPLFQRDWEDREQARYAQFDWAYGTSQQLPSWTWDGPVVRFAPSTVVPGELRFTYIQAAPTLASASDSIGWPYTINSWHQYLVHGLCIHMKQKQDMDWQQHKVQQDQVLMMIEQAAQDRIQTGMRQVLNVDNNDWIANTFSIPRMR
jgi:hypothetical protein